MDFMSIFNKLIEQGVSSDKTMAKAKDQADRNERSAKQEAEREKSKRKIKL